MPSFFIGAKTRVLKGEAAPKGKGGKGRVFPREKPYPERVKGNRLRRLKGKRNNAGDFTLKFL